MEQFLEQLFASFDLPLMISITILSYIVIKVIDISPLKNTTSFGKHVITAIAGILLCVGYYYIVKLPIDKIIPTYLLTTAFYDFIIKKVLDKLNISYTTTKDTTIVETANKVSISNVDIVVNKNTNTVDATNKTIKPKS